MVYVIEGILASAVVLGSLLIVWGGRYLRLSASVVAVAFTITALSWIAFLITTIGITVGTLVMSSG